MTAQVRLKRGIELTLDGGNRVVFDGNSPGDVRVLSHAHSDHLVRSHESPVVCSGLTAALAAARGGGHELESTGEHPMIDLRPAGHVAGSRSALVTDPVSSQRILYTGDISTRSRFYLDGFDPVPADILIIETTYGQPAYRFPSDEVLFPRIRDWLTDTMDSIVLLFGYALGRAQKLQQLAMQAGRSRVFVADSVARTNAVIESYRDVTFDAHPLDTVDHASEFEAGDAIVLPARAKHHPQIRPLLDHSDAITAGFSGWAIDDSYRYRTGYDTTFPLSDHCDFDELVDVVHAVDPDTVYTHHGSTDAFATYLTRDHGYHARALKQNQATLDDF